MAVPSFVGVLGRSPESLLGSGEGPPPQFHEERDNLWCLIVVDCCAVRSFAAAATADIQQTVVIGRKARAYPAAADRRVDKVP